MGVQGWDPEALARLGKALPRVQGTGVEVCKDQPHMKRAERLLDGGWYGYDKIQACYEVEQNEKDVVAQWRMALSESCRRCCLGSG